jgi:ATP-dependent helicase/nuclease subunit B
VSAPARLFTIHPAAPFLPTLAEALLDGRLIPGRSYRENPLALADVTLFLPTRRAVRVLGDTFRGLLGGAAVLPRLKAVSDDLDDMEADPLALPGDLDRPPAMTAAERHLTLARLVIRWREFVASDRLLTPSGAPLAVPASTADALRLAADLLKLIDQAALEGIDWNGLATLVPDEYAAWWQLTLTFLDIAARTLPEAIAEQGKSDPVAERRRAMSETVASWAARPPRGPVIVAGSTGSVASTAELMDAVRHLDEGAIVLPGLDLDSDDAVFAAALDDPCHGQHTMAALLARLGLERADAVELAEPAPPARARRLHRPLADRARRPRRRSGGDRRSACRSRPRRRRQRSRSGARRRPRPA